MNQADYPDLQAPPPARAPFFDEARDAWVLSRYRDVIAALRDPALWPVAARGEDQAATRDSSGRLRLRGASQDALAASHVTVWEAQAGILAERALDRLPANRPTDLLAELALPWCLE